MTINVNVNLKHEGSHLTDAMLELNDSVEQWEKNMSAALQKVVDDVAALKTVNASVIALLNGLAQQIKDLKDDPAALTALATDIETMTADGAAAVTANTTP